MRRPKPCGNSSARCACGTACEALPAPAVEQSSVDHRIVTIGDDLQNPPDEIPRLLAKLDEGYDVVYGTPQKEQHGLLRLTTD